MLLVAGAIVSRMSDRGLLPALEANILELFDLVLLEIAM